MRRGLGGLIISIAVAGATLFHATPASACSCASLGLDRILEGAAAVFVGTPVGRYEIGHTQVDEDAPWQAPVRWQFEVDTVLVGDVAELVEVGTGYGEGDCGVDFSRTGRVGVVASRDALGFTTSSCSGVWAPDVLEAAAGPGSPPAPGPDRPAPAPGVPAWFLPSLVAIAALGLASAAGARRRRLPVQDGWRPGDGSSG